MLKSYKLHQSARSLGPIVAVVATIAGSIYCLILFEPHTTPVVVASIAVAIGATVFSGFLPGIILVRIPVACPACGGRSFAGDKKQPMLFKCAGCGLDHVSDFKPGDFFLGLLVTAMGITVSIVLPVTLEDVGWGAGLFMFFFGLIWVLIGLLVIGALTKINAWLSERWSTFGKIPWETIGVCLATFGPGIFFMLISISDPREDTFPEGRPVVFVAGLVFFLVGVAVVTPRFFGGNEQATAQMVVSSMLITAFMAIPVILASHEETTPVFASAGIVGILALLGWKATLQRLIPHRLTRRAVYVVVLLALASLFYIQRRFLAQAGVPAPSWQPEPVSFTLSPSSVPVGGKLTVTFDRPVTWPEGHYFVVSIVETPGEEGDYGKMQYMQKDIGEMNLWAPDQPGHYEVRLYHGGIRRLLFRQPLEVTSEDHETTVTPESPSTDGDLEKR